MADGLDDLQLDDLPGQQPQRPGGVTFRRRAEPQRDDLRFLLAAEKFLHGRLVAALALERLLEAVRHEPLPQLLDRAGAAVESLGDPLIGPGRTRDIGLQQHLRAANLLTRAVELLDHLAQRTAFLRR